MVFKYSEIFSSTQGEGILTGVPSTFFRTSFCNIRCWFCDTDYTSWSPETKEISVEDAEAQIRAMGNKHVVITGGEPFLWKEELKSLCRKLSFDHHVTIETNATIFHPVQANLISLSPKLASSTPWNRDTKWAKKHEKKRINIPVIQDFLNHYDCQLKFVICDGGELDEIQSIVNELDNIQPDRILLMPEGQTREEIEDKQLMVLGICEQFGWRYSDRLHTRIYGKTRGV